MNTRFDRITFDLVHQAIAFMWNQLAGARNLPGLTEHRVIGQPCRRIAEDLVHPGCCERIVGRNVVPHVNAVLVGLRRPDNPHD